MADALSLFYDEVWAKAHYEKMPEKFKTEIESLQRNHLQYNSTYQQLIWTAYVRSPVYLGGRAKQRFSAEDYTKLVKEYFDWIYAPLLQVNPSLKHSIDRLKTIWNPNDYKALRQGGCDSIKSMPSRVGYGKNSLEQALENANKPFRRMKYYEGTKDQLIYSLQNFQEKWDESISYYMLYNSKGYILAFTFDFAAPNQFMNWTSNPLED